MLNLKSTARSSVVDQKVDLACDRLARLAHGQLTLLKWKIEEILHSRTQECERELHRLIGEVKDWTFMVESRAKPLGERAKIIVADLYDRICTLDWQTPDRIEQKVKEGQLLRPGVLLNEFQSNELTPGARSEFARLFALRATELARGGRNVGFEFVLGTDDFRQILGADCSVTLVHTDAGRILSGLVMYSTLDLVTQGGKDVVAKYLANNSLSMEQMAYGDLVFTDRQISGRMAGNGRFMMSELIDAATKSLAACDVKRLICEVRSGNLVERYYRLLGFVETGLTRIKNGYELKLFSLEVDRFVALNGAPSTQSTNSGSPEVPLLNSWTDFGDPAPAEVLALPHIAAQTLRALPNRVVRGRKAVAIATAVVDRLPHLRDEICIKQFNQACGKEALWLTTPDGGGAKIVCIYHGRKGLDEWYMVGQAWPDVYSTFDRVLEESLAFLTVHKFNLPKDSEANPLIRDTRSRIKESIKNLNF